MLWNGNSDRFLKVPTGDNSTEKKKRQGWWQERTWYRTTGCHWRGEEMLINYVSYPKGSIFYCVLFLRSYLGWAGGHFQFPPRSFIGQFSTDLRQSGWDWSGSTHQLEGILIAPLISSATLGKPRKCRDEQIFVRRNNRTIFTDNTEETHVLQIKVRCLRRLSILRFL